MDAAAPYAATVEGVSFSFLTTEDIRRLSVKQVVNPQIFDALGNATVGGLYDPAFGAERGQMCVRSTGIAIVRCGP